MFIFPAIDLLNGKAVRLFQGNYEISQVFSEDPVDTAKLFIDNRTEFLHLVDLDGAKDGVRRNFGIIKNIAAKYPEIFIQTGGGLRDEAAVEQCLSAGVSRVILGTSALKNRKFLRQMLDKYNERIAVGVDAREQKVSVEGWLKNSDEDSIDFCKKMVDIGVKYIIYTDILRDGAGIGANLQVYEKLMRIEGADFIASGGISSLSDIKSLKDTGLYAVIIGKALYTKDINLKQAISIAAK